MSVVSTSKMQTCPFDASADDATRTTTWTPRATRQPMRPSADAGLGHCRSAVLDGDETDVDCGGPCAACDSSERAIHPRVTAGGRCAVALSTIVTASGAAIPAFVRDGAVLLARHPPGT